MRFLKAACRPGNIKRSLFYWLPVVGFLLTVIACADEAAAVTGNETAVSGKNPADFPPSFGFGRPATASEIAAWDIDISPDGKGLPAGSGNVTTGRNIYALKCAACHGKTGKEGPLNKLVGAMGDTTKAKTIGNYWPYATTLFDYMRRTMPYNAPGSLPDDEVYSLAAFLLFASRIIDSTVTMNKETLPAVKMPAQPYFVPDDRKGGPEVR
jgi:S-disulfanyl-L-cysteine oxidoreductase SoxD